ncbi:MAG: hypothetical protein ACXW1B_01695 [Nitrososphaeraceae archaeon]
MILNKPQFYALKITNYISTTTLTPMELTNRFKELKYIEYQLEGANNRPDIKDFLDNLRKEIQDITGLKDTSGNNHFFPLTREHYIQEKVTTWVEHNFKDYTLFDKFGAFRQSLPNLSSASKPEPFTPDYAYCTNTYKHFAKEKFLFGKPFSRNDLIDNFKFFDLKSFTKITSPDTIKQTIKRGDDITCVVINDNLSSIKTIASFKGQKQEEILKDTLFYCSEHHSIFQKRKIFNENGILLSSDFYDPIKNIIEII